MISTLAIVFVFIIFLIASVFYIYISRYNIKEEYRIKDIHNNTVIKIRGDYIDISSNGERIHIAKQDGDIWYFKKADERGVLEYDSVFSVGGREFELIRTEKRTGRFIVIPLAMTVITVLALFMQTYTLLNHDQGKEIRETEQNPIDDPTENPVNPEPNLIDNEVSDQKNDKGNLFDPNIDDESSLGKNKKKEDIPTETENDADLSKEGNCTDWETFQQSDRERRTLLNNPSELGIQVSKYQKKIAWDKVKADGIDYAIIQAGSRGYEIGGLRADPYFKENIEGAIANGIKVGVSFHSQAINREEIDEEIELIMKSIEGYPLDYPIGITLLQAENFRTSILTLSDYADLITYFCNRIEEKGYTPMIMGEASWFDQFSDGDFFDGYLKMVYDPDNPPSDIDNCIIWIYNAHSVKMIDGIGDNIEVAISMSSYIEEDKY